MGIFIHHTNHIPGISWKINKTWNQAEKTTMTILRYHHHSLVVHSQKSAQSSLRSARARKMVGVWESTPIIFIPGPWKIGGMGMDDESAYFKDGSWNILKYVVSSSNSPSGKLT